MKRSRSYDDLVSLARLDGDESEGDSSCYTTTSSTNDYDTSSECEETGLNLDDSTGAIIQTYDFGNARTHYKKPTLNSCSVVNLNVCASNLFDAPMRTRTRRRVADEGWFEEYNDSVDASAEPFCRLTTPDAMEDFVVLNLTADSLTFYANSKSQHCFPDGCFGKRATASSSTASRNTIHRAFSQD